MHDRNHQYPPQSSSAPASNKQIGSYLIDAGLLTPAQINVALIDQQATGMRFGEIIVARGWLKEQTIEWIMLKVVEPERRALMQPTQMEAPASDKTDIQSPQSRQTQPKQMVLHSTRPNPASLKPPRPIPPDLPTTPSTKSYVRREVPISKPLPSVGASGEDVPWVG
jgi:hypothetical protein